MIKISRFVFNPFSENTYVVYDDGNEPFRAVVIDPGAESAAERKKLFDYIDGNKLSVEYVLLTHGHFDHTCTVNDICDRYGAKLAMNEEDLIVTMQNDGVAGRMGFSRQNPRKIDRTLQDGDVVKLNNCDIKVLQTPGHSPGGLSFYIPSEEVLFSGDTLFRGSIGRTDFSYGDYPSIIESIIKKLISLPESTVVLPGHGMQTDISTEKETNPFIREVVDGEINPSI